MTKKKRINPDFKIWLQLKLLLIHTLDQNAWLECQTIRTGMYMGIEGRDVQSFWDSKLVTKYSVVAISR